MRIIASIAAALLVSPALAQEHAPLPEQCKADAHLWHSQKKADNDKLSFDELQQRSREMWACASVDKTATEDEDYHLLWSGYQVMSGQRMKHFIDRHDLSKQFLDEDAAGAR
jgi:hypothetical protein